MTDMTKIMPQEIEVWYLLPALRRELAKIFIEHHNMTQKDAAKILAITEAAISQYLSEKRGGEVQFSRKELKIIEEVAVKIIKEPQHLTRFLYEACSFFRGSKSLCDLHRKHDTSLSKGCNICMDD
jgi:uncharacterized protein